MAGTAGAERCTPQMAGSGRVVRNGPVGELAPRPNTAQRKEKIPLSPMENIDLKISATGNGGEVYHPSHPPGGSGSNPPHMPFMGFRGLLSSPGHRCFRPLPGAGSRGMTAPGIPMVGNGGRAAELATQWFILQTRSSILLIEARVHNKRPSRRHHPPPAACRGRDRQ